MKVEIELQEIEGFEYTGEYRPPVKGEHYYDEGKQLVAQAARHDAHLILKKIAPKYTTIWIDREFGNGCHWYNVQNHQNRVEFVEIKALEDALSLVTHALKDTDDYKALARLLK